MDHKQLRRSKKLIRKLCCNYDHGNCLALDDGEPCVCVQGISYSLLCNWFRNAVLPADHELLADVMRERPEKRCAALPAALNTRKSKITPAVSTSRNAIAGASFFSTSDSVSAARTMPQIKPNSIAKTRIHFSSW